MFGCYPEVRQLQADLYEGVGADTEFLDPSFSKVSEGKHMAVHIICKSSGNSQGAEDLILDLKSEQNLHRKCKRELFTVINPGSVWIRNIHLNVFSEFDLCVGIKTL